MNRDELNLLMVAEEAGEVVQAASKYLRFGGNVTPPSGGVSNRDALRAEVLDVMACALFLQESELIDKISEADVCAHRAAKMEKITRMLVLSESLGRLQPSAGTSL